MYVDDVVMTGTSENFITMVKEFLKAKFSIMDLGALHYFLSIKVARSSTSVFRNQRKYALDMISEAWLIGCKPSPIPIDPRHKLAMSTTPLLADPSSYRSLVGKLIYLTMMRPNLAYEVHALSQFMNNLTEDHQQAAFKVLRYLKNAPAQGLFYPADQPLTLSAFCDADWGSCPITRRFVTNYVVLLGKSLVSWKKKKDVFSWSSLETE